MTTETTLTTPVNNGVEKKPLTGIQKVSHFLNSDSIKNKFAELLGKRAPGFLSSVLAVCNQNELLKNATTESIYSAALMAATLDLPINSNLGFAYIVPYKDGKTSITSAQFQMGYKGFKQLAIRSGQFAMLHAKEVYEGQKVDDNSFLGYHFDWSAKKSETVIGYASNFLLLSGFESTFYMSVEQLTAHGTRYSQTFRKGYGLWKDDFHKMCLKTVNKLHLNAGEAPLSIDMQKAIISDQSVLDENLNVKYMDNLTEHEEVETDHELERAKLLFETCKNQIEIDELFSNQFADPELRPEIADLYASIKSNLPKK